MEEQEKLNNSLQKDSIEPYEYFKYIKSKLNKSEKQKLIDKLSELPYYIREAKNNGQEKLYEDLITIFRQFIHEQEAAIFGYDTFVWREDISKFIEQVPGHACKICYLENFPRIIPKKQSNIIKKIKEKNIFDKIAILYLDYTNKEVETIQDKIDKRNKDPIAFGIIEDDKNKYFYICDWVDEYCDLTFDKFIDGVKNIHPDYAPNKTVPITTKYINECLEDLNLRKQKLKESHEPSFNRELKRKSFLKNVWDTILGKK